MNSVPQVLVVDGTSDTEAVLKAVLEPRGAQVERTRSANASQRVQSSSSAPKVVVIDLDDESAEKTATCFPESHRVLIGSEKASVTSRDRFLAKPFQYPELLQAIEDLLDLPRAS